MKTQKLRNPTETVTKDGKTITRKTNQIKSLWRSVKDDTGMSLKAFARAIVHDQTHGDGTKSALDIEYFESARRWLANKTANPRAPLKGIGRTHKPKPGPNSQKKSS